MAKFVYSMQNILNIKLKLESQAKIVYGQANAKVMEEQRILTEMVLKRTRYEKELKELMNGPLDVVKVNQMRDQVSAMKTIARRQMMVVHKAEIELEDARRALNEIMIERKTQEVLRDKAFEQFKMELARQESKEIDELVSYTYNHA